MLADVPEEKVVRTEFTFNFVPDGVSHSQEVDRIASLGAVDRDLAVSALLGRRWRGLVRVRHVRRRCRARIRRMCRSNAPVATSSAKVSWSRVLVPRSSLCLAALSGACKAAGGLSQPSRRPGAMFLLAVPT
jgi:hypothetical protein